MDRELGKRRAAEAALAYVEPDTILGVGTGSTVNWFIDALAPMRHRIEGAVASSVATAERLAAAGIRVVELNDVDEVPVYVDGADEATRNLQLIKGGGGALTREKVIATAARRFVCIVDESKMSRLLGHFPVPVEVIPMARSFVARRLVALGGLPELRAGFTTDNGNVILDVHNLKLTDAVAMETAINQIPGVLCNGIFAQRPADVLLVGSESGVETVTGP